MWGLVWEGCREGGREGIQQRRASRTGQGQQGKGMRRWGSGMARINTRVSLATTLLRHLRRSPPFVAATAASSTPPPPIHLRISVALLAPKAFLATAFLMLGRRNVVLWITLERHTPRSGQERRLCMGMVSGAWLFYIPSRTRKSDLRARLAMSNGRLRLEPSDAGSCFRVGNTKRWISDVDGGVGHWTGHGPTGVGACAWCTAWRHQSIPRYAINFGRGLTRCLENTSNGQGL